MRVKRIILKYESDVALARRQRIDALGVDGNLTAARLLEPGDQPQDCRFAAARRAEQYAEFAVGDIERDVF